MITPQSLIITMDDCLQAGHCARGVRRWMHRYGFDFRSFMRDGLSAADMLGTKDGQGRQVVARTVKRRVLKDLDISEDLAIEQLERGTDG